MRTKIMCLLVIGLLVFPLFSLGEAAVTKLKTVPAKQIERIYQTRKSILLNDKICLRTVGIQYTDGFNALFALSFSLPESANGLGIYLYSAFPFDYVNYQHQDLWEVIPHLYVKKTDAEKERVKFYHLNKIKNCPPKNLQNEAELPLFCEARTRNLIFYDSGLLTAVFKNRSIDGGTLIIKSPLTNNFKFIVETFSTQIQ